MLIVALVLAVIGLAALVTAVVTSNEVIAWVCIGASVIGVVLLIVDALRERSRGESAQAATEAEGTGETAETAEAQQEYVEDYPEDEAPVAQDVAQDEHSDTETAALEQHDEEDEEVDEVAGEDRNSR